MIFACLPAKHRQAQRHKGHKEEYKWIVNVEHPILNESLSAQYNAKLLWRKGCKDTKCFYSSRGATACSLGCKPGEKHKNKNFPAHSSVFHSMLDVECSMLDVRVGRSFNKKLTS
jgi:hypothetical protein